MSRINDGSIPVDTRRIPPVPTQATLFLPLSLNIRYQEEIFQSSDFTCDGTYSTVSLTNSVTDELPSSTMSIVWLNGVRDIYSTSAAPTATNEYYVTGSTLTVLGDVTSMNDTYLVSYFRDPQ